MSVGENLRKIRKELRLTREEVAKIAKIHPQTLYMYEVGKRTPPLGILKCLAKALSCKVERLISHEDGQILLEVNIPRKPDPFFPTSPEGSISEAQEEALEELATIRKDIERAKEEHLKLLKELNELKDAALIVYKEALAMKSSPTHPTAHASAGNALLTRENSDQ